MAKRITHKHSFLAWAVLSTVSYSEAVLEGLHAAELNTQVPTATEGAGFPVQINLPAQPLNQSIRQLANQTGLSISFDSELTKHKTAPAVKGFLSPQEALKKVLQGSGLQLNISGDSAVIKPEPEKNAQALKLDAVEVRAKRFYEVGPLPGLGLTKEEIPGNVQSISSKEIKEAHSLSLTDLMNKKLQSVTVNDYQGNPFQMDVQYRGFTAGPQIGTPQGLSVFFDGIRVNEPFGDVVNWDMIPMNALAGVDVFPGSNPIFGLNTLGGAFTLKTKDGFNNAGFDADVLTGSFGRKQLQVEGGWNNGTVGLFAAGNFFLEDGWRENSPSKVNQFFSKASFRGDKLDLNLSTLLVGTDLTGNGLLPSEMYAQDRNGVFSSPDTTKNRLSQFQLSSSYFVNDNFTITGQVYRRNSKRHQVGADVMRDYDEELTAKRLPPAGSVFSCLYRSSKANQYGPGSQANRYGLPDYLVIPIENYDPATNNIGNTAFFDELLVQGTFNLNNYIGNINQELPDAFVAGYRSIYERYRNFTESEVYNRINSSVPTSGPSSPTFFNENTFSSSFSDTFIAANQSINGVIFDQSYFFTQDPVTNAITKNYVFILGAANEADCLSAPNLVIPDPTNPFSDQFIDGVGANQTGYVPGTPTAVFTDNQINQMVNGASVQFNWNLENHKLMIGASIDAAEATYENEQRLGFLNANRKAYLDPAQAHPQFAGAFVGLRNNDFEGTNTTKSVYFSETWSPIKEWNFNASARYNITKTKNKIAARSGLLNYTIGELIASPDKYNICTDIDNDGDVDAIDCAAVPTGYRPLRLTDTLGPAETEKFSYYSFNPSFGATWQAKENLNIFANWSKGTRTPSVIELGCALDKTPTGPLLNDGFGNDYQEPKSLAENRQCTLPTSLSGDPYLPQIKATTYDIGMRGTLNNLYGASGLQWNVGAYQTDLKDDIYFVAVGNGQGFFDSIGNTRRRGLEVGLSGKLDKWGFGINYSLTDATFQNDFLLYSENNSSAQFIAPLGPNVIQVKKGNRMPGVPLHNLNASISYEVTPQWQVGFSAVAHSDIFVRGNENNEHRQGVVRTIPVVDPVLGPTTRDIPPTNNPGSLPGYVTFNFQTSYKFNSEWTATMQVINLFDKEYFTAGRLGSNPFSPSIYGAIGPSGYNHNSGDWRSTNFIAPSAPRGVWFSLNWHFDPSK